MGVLRGGNPGPQTEEREDGKYGGEDEAAARAHVKDGGCAVLVTQRGLAGSCWAQPFATNAGGGWAVTDGRVDCIHVFCAAAVPGHPGAIACSGSGYNATVSELAAVWITTDGGRSFGQIGKPGGRVYHVFCVGGQMFACQGSTQTYRWNGLLPGGGEAVAWDDAFVPLAVPGWPDVVCNSRIESNGTIAVRSGGAGTYVFDGTTAWDTAVTGWYIDAYNARDGWLYVIGSQGLFRTKDGRAWWKHPSSGIWGGKRSAIQAECVAVCDGVVYAGEKNSTIWAACPTNVAWTAA